jgi:electron transfer flavoprotein alpha/beta subunit
MTSDLNRLEIARIIREQRDNPRFRGRRSIDKSCGQVVEIIADFVPAEGFPVVETIDLPNSEGEEAAVKRAEELSDLYTTDLILAALHSRAHP